MKMQNPLPLLAMAVLIGVSHTAGAADGTVQYDDGNPTTDFGGGAIVGNRFNTNTGVPVLLSGTVDTIQAVVVPGAVGTNAQAVIHLYGAQTAGGGATGLFSTTVTGLTGAQATVTVTPNIQYTGSSFLVLLDDDASGYIPSFGTGTNLGQGHHGLVGYTGGQYPDIASTFNFGNTLTGLIRASGNFLPVELLDFSVE